MVKQGSVMAEEVHECDDEDSLHEHKRHISP
jgi:hypothetical protein